MTLKIIVAPSGEPVTLAEAKSQCRVDISDEDALITSLIVSARRQAEVATERAFITQTWELYLDAFQCGSGMIYMPLPPLQSVTSITYTDVNGAVQTVSASDYKVDVVSEPARILPAYGKSWPATRDEINAVIVRFVAGYGAASAVPQPLKQWILLQVEHWFRNRGAAAEKQLLTLPFVDSLLDAYRFRAIVS